ncbi:MAG TPA: phosphatidate cytidylyltransferase [Candidatus Nanoarchaeia archaeon]|nr:phosphatidate cytidylyltransferase [Candidatus Nanoarchaeia archaeon]
MSLEVKRHSFHIIGGTALALLYYFDLMAKAHFEALLIVSIILAVIYKRYKIPIIHQAMLAMERKQNLQNFPGIGVVFFLLSSTIAIWIYPKNIAVAAIMILSWADGIAGLIGRHGKVPYFNPKKTWEGIILAIIAGTIVAQFFVPLLSALLASTISMFIEGLDLKIGKWKIDDNLFIPILAGAVMMLG